MATRLRINARALASAGGTATFSFNTAPPQHVYEGTLTLLPDIAQSSLDSIALSPFVGDAPWGTFLGSQISGLIQQWHDDDAPLVVTATGLQPNHAYALWWIGTNYDRSQGDRPELKSPATPLNANITTLSEATLDFQHNDALVASELAMDLEDGGGVTWSLTDDPTNKRMKVGVTVAPSALTRIAQQVISSNVASVTFSAIPQTYTSLHLIAQFAGMALVDVLAVRVNGDATAIYNWIIVGTDAGSAAADTAMHLSAARNNGISLDLLFPGYADTGFGAKLMRALVGISSVAFNSIAGFHNAAAAITSLSLFGTGGQNLTFPSTFTLYGIA